MATPAIKIQFSLAGDMETLQLLRELPQKLVKGALRKSLRESAKIIQRGAKFRAPRDSGTLIKSIKVRAFKRTRKAVVGFSVSTAEGDYKGKTFYGGFQEYGWRHTGRHRASTGVKTSQKWLREERQALSKKGGVVPLPLKRKANAARRYLAKGHPKVIKPKYFLRNAFKDNVEAIQADLVKSIKTELQAAAVKAATPKTTK